MIKGPCEVLASAAGPITEKTTEQYQATCSGGQDWILELRTSDDLGVSDNRKRAFNLCFEHMIVQHLVFIIRSEQF